MRQTILLLMIVFVVRYADAQQWLIEYPYHDNEDVVFTIGDMSGKYNYSFGYRYDKVEDIMYPHALCVDQEGNYISKDIEYEGVKGAFNSALGMSDNNVFVTAYCTDYEATDTYEKMWVAVVDPDLNILYESYVSIEDPYVSFGHTAYSVVNDDNKFVVLTKVAKNVAEEIMLDCDFVFYEFDEQCNLLYNKYLENTSYNSEISDFVFIPYRNCYAIFGRAMNVTGVNSVIYVDEEFTYLSCLPIDNLNNYPNYIRPYFVSVGHCYEDNTILMSMQTRNTSSLAEYCPLVLRVDIDMNIVDSIMFERKDITDYVSQYNSIAYVNPNTIYVSTFEVGDMYNLESNTSIVYVINDNLDLLGSKKFCLGYFMNILYVQPTQDGGCIVQAYYEKDSDKVAYICKLSAGDFDVAVEEYKDKVAIESYPNPVSSILNINVGEIKGDDIMITIYDISGRRCMDYTVMIEDKIISIDLSLFKSGMYYYSITDDYGNVVIDKFVKK